MSALTHIAGGGAFLASECDGLSDSRLGSAVKNLYNEAVRLRLEKSRRLEVSLSGESMMPLLQSGDTVLVKPVSEMKRGGLYLFELPDGSLGVHRMIGCEDGFVLMKGDNCMRVERVGRDCVLGSVEGMSSGAACPFKAGRVFAVSAVSRSVALLSSLHARPGARGEGVVCETVRASLSLVALRAIDRMQRAAWLGKTRGQKLPASGEREPGAPR